MEAPSFLIDVIINEVQCEEVLIDNGCQSYASVNQKFIRNHKPEIIDIKPRVIEGFLPSVRSTITQAAKFTVDLAGYKRSIWAYIVPRQVQNMIFGRAFLVHNCVHINEEKEALEFKKTGHIVPNKQRLARVSNQTEMIASETYISIVSKSQQKNKPIETYSITLADIDKALAPKKLVDPNQHMPNWLGVEFKKNFQLAEANKLPNHRPEIDHHIPLEMDSNGVEKPVPWCALYNNSRDELLVLRKTLTELLEKSFIRVSKSSAGAPVLFVKKPGGGLRFCVDYRGLNAITKKDRYPLPLIKETLRTLSQARYLTKLDVSQAFHQIRMAKGEEWKTAFRTRYGSYEWNVVPFGLTGAPATFQCYINWLLREYLDDFCTAYIDDILIFSSGSTNDHRNKVKQVLTKLQEGGLTLDITKCEFEVKWTKYLGYIIDVERGISMDPDKVKAIEEWEEPKTVKGVRAFLGFANFYRTFIKNYSDLAIPLTRLTQKDIPFNFDSECRKSFITLKNLFTKDPILMSFDPDRRTVLEPDASNWAVGGVLSQYEDNGTLRSVA